MPIKENSADIIQHERLEREKKLAPRSRICDIAITAVFCLFIGGFALMHIITPDKEYSERENRVLESFPKFSADALFSGSYTADMTEYLSDQFPLRDVFVSIKSNAERIAMRMENGGIMFDGDALTARADHPDMENLDENLSSSEKFAASLENSGIDTVLAVAGRRSDVCTRDLPDSYGEGNQNALWEAIDAAGKNFSGEYNNLRNPLRNLDKLGEDVYYRTDHHWTTLGAHYAYLELWESLPDSLIEGLSPRRSSEFKKETVTTEFYGTSHSSSGATWVTPDEIDLWRFAGDDTMTVTVKDTGEILTGLYRMEFLEVKDKYSVFLGENAGRVDIGTGDRPTVMLIKDSFAQSIAPFLAMDFDIIMIDPRYYGDSIYRTAIEEQPDAVVILMNADTLTTTAVLRPLLRGVQ